MAEQNRALPGRLRRVSLAVGHRGRSNVVANLTGEDMTSD